MIDRYMVVGGVGGSGAYIVDTDSPPSDTSGQVIATCNNSGQAAMIVAVLNS